MNNIRVICSVCPNECEMITWVEEGKIVKVEGNGCTRGVEYAKTEAVNPKRQLTTTVKINNAKYSLLPVRTTMPISLEDIPKSMEIIKKIEVSAPIKMGDIILKNILDTGIDVVASRSLYYYDILFRK